jgi:hypothetical protein
MESLGTLTVNQSCEWVRKLRGLYFKLHKTEVYEVGHCLQKGIHVEIYGSIVKSSQPFVTGCSDEYQNFPLLENEGHYGRWYPKD